MADELGQAMRALEAKAEARKVARKTARGAAWNRVVVDYPDCAEFIKGMTERFGRPEILIVVDLASNDVVLDSRRL